MLLGIDHLVIAVADVDAAAETLEREVGLTVGPGGRHVPWGTVNRLAWLGDAYVELIGVEDAALARETWVGAPVLEALRGGGGLVVAPLATDDIAADARALRRAGSGLGDPLPGERVRPDGRTVRWTIARPQSISPTAPFLIEHDTTAAEWTPQERAERAAQRHPAGGPVRLEALELPVEHVGRAILRLTRAAGLRFRPSLAGRGGRDTNVGPHVLRVRPVRADDGGRTAVVRLAGPGLPYRSVDSLGCGWVLRAV